MAGGNPGGYLFETGGNNDSKPRAIAHIMKDLSETTGSQTIDFDYESVVHANNNSANTLEFGVFGLDEGETVGDGFDGAFDMKGGPGSFPLPPPPSAVPLITGASTNSDGYVTLSTPTGTSVPWTAQSFKFDLGANGYEYVGLHWRLVGYDKDRGNPEDDSIGIDNVEITEVVESPKGSIVIIK